MTTIYTIGHSRHAADDFVAMLHAQEIARLVDVRSHPASRWAPQFGKAALAQTLANHAIEYLFLGRELGGRPDGAEYYRSEGTVDYDRRAQAPDFTAGVERLVALARDRRTAIMCAEEHHHAALGMLTPADVHHGLVERRVTERQAVLDAAFAAHPERFPRARPVAQRPAREVWINKPMRAPGAPVAGEPHSDRAPNCDRRDRRRSRHRACPLNAMNDLLNFVDTLRRVGG